MKRFIISLATLLVLSGCSSNTVNYSKMEPKEQYKFATEQFKKVNSFSSNATIEMTMTIDGESMPVNSAMHIKTINAQDPQTVEMEIKQTLDGIDQIMYFKDDFMYVSIIDQKIKMHADREDMTEIAANAEIAEYDDSMMDNISSEIKDDEVVISFNLNEAYLNETITQLLGTDEDIADLDITIHESNGTLITDGL